MKNIVGIDAGGSRTRVLHASFGATIREFEIKKEAYFDSYNYRQDGIARLNRLIEQIMGSFHVDDRKSTLLLGGFAGAGTPECHRGIQRAFEKHRFRKDLINIKSDADLLLLAVGNVGIVLTAGTGSICVGRRAVTDDEREINVRAGGYGFRAYSEPGGYQLGMRAIDAALRIEDGRSQEHTVLYAQIEEYFDVASLEEITPIIYPRAAKNSNVNRQIAGIAKLVLKAAHEGDKTANHLVTELVHNLAEHILAVYRKLGLRNPLVGLHGGLFSDRHGEELLEKPLKQHALLNKYDLRFIKLGTKKGDIDPLIGAMRRILLENKHLKEEI